MTDGASAGRYRWIENPDSSPNIRAVRTAHFCQSLFFSRMAGFPFEYSIFLKPKILSDSV